MSRTVHKVLIGVACFATCLVALSLQQGCEEKYSVPRRAVDASPAPAPPAPPPPREIADGAASKEAVWTRASDAWKAHDYQVVAHCVAPKARSAWLSTLLTMSFFATMGHLGSTGTPLGDLAALIEKSGASFTPEERMSGIDLETMPQTLLGRVKDQAALLGDLLAWGAKYGAPTDPAKAIKAPQLTAAVVDPEKGLAGSLTEGETTGINVQIEGPPGLTKLLSALSTGKADVGSHEEGGSWYLGEP